MFWLYEATFERDSAYRRIAEKFVDDLIVFLQQPVEQLSRALSKRSDGYTIPAWKFTRQDEFRNVMVLFRKQKSGPPAIGAGRSSDGSPVRVLVLPVLMDTNDVTYIDTRVSGARSEIVHEIIHMLDPSTTMFLFNPSKKHSSSAEVLAQRGEKSYYNHPSEWNAYWQEGAAAVERLLKSPVAQSPVPRKAFFGDGSLAQFKSRASRFWRKEFLAAMNHKTQRKFDKRLSDLWIHLIKPVFAADS